MGKTTFAMNLVENAAMLQDKPVLIFSLEMPSEQIMMRSLASLSRVDQTRIRTGQLDDETGRVSPAPWAFCWKNVTSISMTPPA
jgi:replicative DNA helicase